MGASWWTRNGLGHACRDDQIKIVSGCMEHRCGSSDHSSPHRNPPLNWTGSYVKDPLHLTSHCASRGWSRSSWDPKAAEQENWSYGRWWLLVCSIVFSWTDIPSLRPHLAGMVKLDRGSAMWLCDHVYMRIARCREGYCTCADCSQILDGTCKRLWRGWILPFPYGLIASPTVPGFRLSWRAMRFMPFKWVRDNPQAPEADTLRKGFLLDTGDRTMSQRPRSTSEFLNGKLWTTCETASGEAVRVQSDIESWMPNGHPKSGIFWKRSVKTISIPIRGASTRWNPSHIAVWSQPSVRLAHDHQRYFYRSKVEQIDHLYKLAQGTVQEMSQAQKHNRQDQKQTRSTTAKTRSTTFKTRSTTVKTRSTTVRTRSITIIKLFFKTYFAAFIIYHLIAFAHGSPVDFTPLRTSLEARASTKFVHPGIFLHTAQLDFIKAKVKSGRQPWTDGYKKMIYSSLGSLTRSPKPRATVECGFAEVPNHGCTNESGDALAAYVMSLAWYITDNAQYAQKAISYMNAWAKTIKTHTNVNALIQTAWAATSWTRAAEIIRYTNADWSAGDIATFENMLRKVYLPNIIVGSDVGYNGNWELGWRNPDEIWWIYCWLWTSDDGSFNEHCDFSERSRHLR